MVFDLEIISYTYMNSSSDNQFIPNTQNPLLHNAMDGPHVLPVHAQGQSYVIHIRPTCTSTGWLTVVMYRMGHKFVHRGRVMTI